MGILYSLARPCNIVSLQRFPVLYDDDLHKVDGGLSLEESEKTMEMSFKEGFSMTINELPNLLETLKK